MELHSAALSEWSLLGSRLAGTSGPRVQGAAEGGPAFSGLSTGPGMEVQSRDGRIEACRLHVEAELSSKAAVMSRIGNHQARQPGLGHCKLAVKSPACCMFAALHVA